MDNKDRGITSYAILGERVVARHVLQAGKEILNPNEKLLAAFDGLALSSESYGLTAHSKGGFRLHDYLLITDSRVIFWARGLASGSTDVFHYEDISSVEEARGLLSGEIVLNIRGAKERIKNMVKEDVSKAAHLIREQIVIHKNRAATHSPPSESITDTLRKLADLKEAGVLTEDEFLKKKTELLERL